MSNELPPTSSATCMDSCREIFNFQTTNADAVQLNHSPSTFERWCELNQLSENGAEMEERARQYLYWTYKQLMFGVMFSGIFQQNCPQHIGRRIVGRVMQLHNDVVLHHMRNYRRSISTDMKWLIFELTEKCLWECFVLCIQ